MGYNSLTLIEKDIREMIELNLDRTGLLYRLYSRIKTNSSINEKIIRKDYVRTGKMIQDIIGMRIITYFSEDIDILVDYFASIFNIVSMEYDNPESYTFSPVRVNLVCRLQENQLKEFNLMKIHYKNSFQFIDSTFEIQIRTTFSEGWHEVEHHMQYKCQNEWDKLENESRMLNGIYATLETNDLTLVKLFNDIAYNHYKNQNWTAMIRNKFRLKFDQEALSPDIVILFNTNKELAKRFYKLSRKKVMNEIIKNDLWMNISFSNIIYLCNYLFIQNEEVLSLTPARLLNRFETLFRLPAIHNTLYISERNDIYRRG